LRGTGISESTWERSPTFRRLAQWDPPVPAGRVIAVAPHPDDEILGVGGTLALLSDRAAEVVLVAVTDGEASHPGHEDHLRRVRPAESATAARRMHIRYRDVHRLGHPDGAVDEALLTAQLRQLVAPGDLVLSPWRHDGHPDHNATGRAAMAAARHAHASCRGYLVWAWHWASPVGGLPWEQARRVDLGTVISGRKRDAVRLFESQISGQTPILPDPVLRRLTRDTEVVVEVQ
jgi:LmbE family N-acetylglucosaminyl deacetylase